MTRKAWLKPPFSDTGRPGSVKATTLGDLARPDARRGTARQCRICLAPESHSVVSGERQSSLKAGICRDRQACESRQPSLIPLDEVPHD
jgi:hypothetical protein